MWDDIAKLYLSTVVIREASPIFWLRLCHNAHTWITQTRMYSLGTCLSACALLNQHTIVNALGRVHRFGLREYSQVAAGCGWDTRARGSARISTLLTATQFRNRDSTMQFRVHSKRARSPRARACNCQHSSKPGACEPSLTRSTSTGRAIGSSGRPRQTGRRHTCTSLHT